MIFVSRVDVEQAGPVEGARRGEILVLLMQHNHDKVQSSHIQGKLLLSNENEEVANASP